jgi:hypothetical protein
VKSKSLCVRKKCGVEWCGARGARGFTAHTAKTCYMSSVCLLHDTQIRPRSSDSEKPRQQVRQPSGFFFVSGMQWMRQEKSAIEHMIVWRAHEINVSNFELMLVWHPKYRYIHQH